jgi:signal transduction histidine kinase
MRGTQKQYIEFEFTPQDASMTVLADDLLEDMFVNLFYSAAFSERLEKTKVSVSVDQRRDRKIDYWWVKVSQPNKSIPNHLKGEVLRMAKTSKSELTGGFGIGLAAAKGIVERYQGSIWVSDIVQRDYTKGCVFNLILPKAK